MDKETIASGIDMSVKSVSNIAKKDIQDLDLIRSVNKQLTQKNKELIKQLGYLDFYDLCLGTISTEQLKKGGNKDFSKLTPVEQTVIRNGKPTKMKIYVDSNKDEDTPEKNDVDKDKSSNSKVPVQASELSRDFSFGNLDSKTTPKKALSLSSELEDWADKRDFSNSSSDYLEGRDEGGVLRFVMGVSRVKDFVQADFIISDGTVSGFWLTSFYELLKLALDNRLGVKFPDLNNKALYMLSLEYNMQKQGEYLVATFDELTEAVGDT